MSAVLDYFMKFKELGVFLVSMIPIVELRGAIPAGVALGINPIILCIMCIIGNMIPIPFILLFIRPIFNALKKTKMFNFIKKLEDRALNKSESVRKKSFLGLMIFVAIPLPGTGAWTGALIAALLNMRFKKALPAIFVGVVIAGILVTVACELLKYGVFTSGFMYEILQFIK
ncbi:MAG: small multi-drug export protein [Clostridia bacterium]|nr:small multi-drug export protein [Clostridia bacterium]